MGVENLTGGRTPWPPPAIQTLDDSDDFMTLWFYVSGTAGASFTVARERNRWMVQCRRAGVTWISSTCSPVIFVGVRLCLPRPCTSLSLISPTPTDKMRLTCLNVFTLHSIPNGTVPLSCFLIVLILSLHCAVDALYCIARQRHLVNERVLILFAKVVLSTPVATDVAVSHG